MKLTSTWASACKMAGLMAAGLGAMTAAAGAQSYPSKPIKLIITLSAGSASDSVARVVGEQLSQQMGQPFIYENRPGGGGTIGAGAVAKADPDGYTLLINTNLHTLAPSVMANVPYDVEKDFAGVALLGVAPHILIISPSQGVKTLKEFVDMAKKRPGGITYASTAGSGTHLNGAHFVQQMKLDARMVPFKGAPESITEVMTARVDIYFSPILPALSLVQDGKLLALGVTSSKRSAVLPNVPTTTEAGYEGSSNFGVMVGLFAPAKTPKPIVDQLNGQVAKALALPAIAERLQNMAIVAGVPVMKPAEFDAYISAQMKAEAEQAKAAGLTKQ